MARFCKLNQFQFGNIAKSKKIEKVRRKKSTMKFGFAILVALVVCLFPSGTYQVIIVLLKTKSEKSHAIGARNTSALSQFVKFYPEPLSTLDHQTHSLYILVQDYWNDTYIVIYFPSQVNEQILIVSVRGTESDVVRVFDDKLRLTKKEMEDHLKQANLERYGFNKTVEVSTETDENGKTTKKTTIYWWYVQGYWWLLQSGVLGKCFGATHAWRAASFKAVCNYCQRSSKAYRRSPDERLHGVLEIHPNQCVKKGSVDNGVSKRGTARNICMHIYCMFCWAASIQYDN